jgi:hypothetical protein
VSPELPFAVAFPLAVPFWLLMVVAPGWTWTHRIASSPLIVVPPLLVYAAAVLPQPVPFPAAVGNPPRPRTGPAAR